MRAKRATFSSLFSAKRPTFARKFNISSIYFFTKNLWNVGFWRENSNAVHITYCPKCRKFVENIQISTFAILYTIFEEKSSKWVDGVYTPSFRFYRFCTIFLPWSSLKFRFFWATCYYYIQLILKWDILSDFQPLCNNCNKK